MLWPTLGPRTAKEQNITINRRVQKRLDMEQFHYCVTMFVKGDRETGKVVQKPCSFTRQSRSVQLDSLRLCRAIMMINTKNCSLSIVLTATDQKPQKSLKR